MAGIIWKRRKPGNSASSQPAELYRTCSQLTLDRFKKCLGEGDLSQLIISGTPSLDDLADAWVDIYAEYCDLNSDNEAEYVRGLQKEIMLLADHLVEVGLSLFLLGSVGLPDEGIVELLKDRDYDYPLDPTNIEEFNRSAEIINNRLSAIQLRKEMLEKELQGYFESKESVAIDANYFDRMLTRLARFRKIPVIRASEITVYEFVLMVRDFLECMNQKHKSVEPDGDAW